MKTILSLSILIALLSLFSNSIFANKLYENPELNTIGILNTPLFEVADSMMVESYNETKVIVSNTRTNEFQTHIMYVNVLYYKTIQKKEFYIKRVVSINENAKTRIEVIKVRLGNRTFKLILKNCSIFRYLFDNYQS